MRAICLYDSTGETVRHIIFAVFFLNVFSTQSNAADCPDFYRFVDFGLQAPDGSINRGGPTFRAVNFSEGGLLIPRSTICRDVRETSIDGRGNIIPVVASIEYSPEKSGIELIDLRLTVVENVASLADQSAARHLAKLAQPAPVTTRGGYYLCAQIPGAETVSCQLVSPSGGNLAFVVYCSPSTCHMPVLSLKKNIIAQATWLPSKGALMDHAILALEILGKVRQIQDFLSPLSS